MVFSESSLHEMTLLLLVIVAMLGGTLIWLFSALETSPSLARLRTALVRRDDGRRSNRRGD